MKKLKDLWNQNRVLVVLFTIIIICAIVVIGVVITAFLGSSKSVYGDRLDGIEEVQVTDEAMNQFKKSFNEDDLVSEVSIKSRGKIIYITMLFKDNVIMDEAKSKAFSSLEHFEENYLKFYDFHFTLKQNSTETNEGFLIMGARNANGNGLIWNNNTEVASE